MLNLIVFLVGISSIYVQGTLVNRKERGRAWTLSRADPKVGEYLPAHKRRRITAGIYVLSVVILLCVARLGYVATRHNLVGGWAYLAAGLMAFWLFSALTTDDADDLAAHEPPGNR